MHHMIRRSTHPLLLLALGGLWLAPLASATAQADAPENILAVFGTAVAQPDPPPGWRFEWNADGRIGDTRGYEALAWTEVPAGRRTQRNYAVPDASGHPLPEHPLLGAYGSVRAFRDAEGIARYAIAAYTLQADADGEVWIQHGNVMNNAFDGALLHVYLNAEQKFSATVPKDRAPFLFQAPLGRARKGDTVRVAIGPGPSADAAAVRLRYILQRVPAGTAPGEPVNILAPPITAAEPQRDADGGYRTYNEKHLAHGQEVLARRPELVFLGDSITARWPAELLEKHYGAYRPVNLGIGGDWVQNVLWRVRNGVLDQVSLKVAVLLIGTNNIANRFSPEEIVMGIERLIRAIREKAPQGKILLLGILPRGASIEDAANDKVRAVNKQLSAIADGERVVYLDVGPALVEPDGSISPEVMPDRLHVAMPGFVRWMDAMQPTLDKLLAD